MYDGVPFPLIWGQIRPRNFFQRFITSIMMAQFKLHY